MITNMSTSMNTNMNMTGRSIHIRTLMNTNMSMNINTRILTREASVDILIHMMENMEGMITFIRLMKMKSMIISIKAGIEKFLFPDLIPAMESNPGIY